MKKKKIIRATTVPGSLDSFCEGLLKQLSEEYEVIGLSSPGEKLEIVGKREGVKTIAIPMERHISPIMDLKALFLLIKVFRREKPDMVHSMTPKAGLLCMMAAWWTKVPVRVHTFTGLVFPTSTGMKRRILMLTDKITCACATHVIPEGEGVKNDLLNNGITKKPLRVLGYGNVRGVDMNHYSRRPEVMERIASLNISNINDGSEVKDVFIFLFVGRIVRDKGINELVEAFRMLHESYSQTRLILVGRFEDSLDPILDSTRKEIELNPGIQAVGQKFGDDLLAYYAASDCFVMPSYREGFPNTVLEAGAMGLPSIVTNINGSREIIVEGENGIIVPPQNIYALYSSMKEMVENPVKRLALASASRARVAERYEQGFVRKCLYDFYREVL